MRLYNYIIERYTRRRTVGPFTKLARATVLNPARRRKVEKLARDESKAHPRALIIMRRAHDRHVSAYLINGRPVDPNAISIELPSIVDDIFAPAVSIPQRASSTAPGINHPHALRESATHGT